MNHSEWYVTTMEKLVDVVRQLSQTRHIDEVTEIVRKAARELTNADGATFVLRDNDQCYYAEENAIEPLWKGQFFPLKACVSGWVMNNSEPAIIEDIYKDPRVPVEAYRPTFVKSMVMVPVRKNDPIAAIGNYWATTHKPTEEEVAILQALADTTSVALENIKLYTNLQSTIEKLEEREASLEIFTRALAHDLKEPMRTIHSFTDLINKQAEFNERSKNYFHHIYNSSERMLALIDTVFQYTQINTAKNFGMQECNLSTILEDVQENLDHLIKERQAIITYDKLPWVHANHTHMMQLLQNLICNSIKHNDKTPTIHFSAKKEHDHWLFSIRDNGRGIDEKNFNRIFEPFKRLTGQSESGTGLGLSICRKIIQAHEGNIWCKSSAVGTTFFFTLPFHVEKVHDLPRVKSVNNSGEFANILLVDDRKADLELTRIMINEQLNIKCNLYETYSSEGMFNILHDHMHKKTPINLILLDINMPGTDGFEVLKRIREDKLLNNVSVAMCTGSTYIKDIEKAKALGAAYLLKPLRIDTLKAVIEQFPGLHLMEEGRNYSLMYAAA